MDHKLPYLISEDTLQGHLLQIHGPARRPYVPLLLHCLCMLHFTTGRFVPTVLLLLLSCTCIELLTTTSYLASLLLEQFKLLVQAILATVNIALSMSRWAQSVGLSLNLRKSADAGISLEEWNPGVRGQL